MSLAPFVPKAKEKRSRRAGVAAGLPVAGWARHESLTEDKPIFAAEATGVPVPKGRRMEAAWAEAYFDK